jgi:integrase
VLENPKGGRHRVYRIFYSTGRDAESFAIQLKAEILKGSYIDPSKLSYGDYLLRWYDGYVKANIAQTTQRRYKQIIDLRVIPLIGDIPIEKLRTTHIKDFYAQIIKEGQIVQSKKNSQGKEEKPVWKPLSMASDHQK